MKYIPTLFLILNICSPVFAAHLAQFTPLPEKQIAMSKDKRTQAFYAEPTNKYPHGILGDTIEATQLVVTSDGNSVSLTLSDNEVFEDIRPRLFDVDNDGVLEVITIRSSLNGGAGIAIYKIIDDRLIEFASLPTIGKKNRWLNIAAITDLDNDGVIELAWVQTPHLGGILKVAQIQKGTLKPITSTRLFSNHAIGQRNLCLSSVTESPEKVKTLYVPSQARKQIVGFQFVDNQLRVVKKINKKIDFSMPLFQQYNFTNLILENQCIH